MTPKFGDYKATVVSIAVALSSERPAIFTRLLLEDKTNQTHAIRLNTTESTRIGIDELRSAFPNLIGSLDDEGVITFIIEKTDSFKDLPVIVGIEAQIDKKTNMPAKGPQGQAYYNIRLRSAVRNLDHTSALSIAKQLMAAATKAKEKEQTREALEEAFGESTKEAVAAHT